MELNLQQLKQFKTSDRIYILGSGKSVLDITEEEWKAVENHDSIGFNHWYVHKHKPTFYDLSYLANDYFEDPEIDMFYQAVKQCSDSKFIINHGIHSKYQKLFQFADHYKTHICHFDFFESDLDSVKNLQDTQIGTAGKYWSTDFFSHFNKPLGELLPNEDFIFKSRGQLFATLQIAVLLGYTDIRLIGVDLNDEGKFQDSYNNAPYSAKSIGHGGEAFQPRLNVQGNVKDPKGVHNTCQGTKDKDYLGIHKLLKLFKEKCLQRVGVSLTVCNPGSLLVSQNIKYQPIKEPLLMNKITFCIPSKTNLRYLKTCIPSIRKNAYRKDHDIIIFVDSDEDGTVEWLKENADTYNVKYYVNPDLGKSLYGIGRAYDYCIKKAETKIVMIFHADMMLGKDADYYAYKHLKPLTVVCSTRIEPPLHPNGGEKILKDFGMYPEEFKESEFNEYVDDLIKDNRGKTTEGIFAPWMIYKEDIQSIGGHDPVMHSCREDSDLFNRFVLNDYTLIQSWDSLVYHLTGRGAGSFDGDPERHAAWKRDMESSTKEFIRKWGTQVQHDAFMKPIISPVYRKSVIINNTNPQLTEALEPWFNDYDLAYQDIIVEVDGSTFTQQDFQIIQKLNDIVKDSGEIGKFELGNLKITINSLTEYQNDLIKL